MAFSQVKIWDGTNYLSFGASGNISTTVTPLIGTPTHTAVSVGTSNTLIANAGARSSLTIINDGTANAYVSFGVSANINTGIRLNANGGNYVFDTYVPQTSIYGIAVGSTINLLVMTA